jgi:gliding motility-associated lipoprotein GldH
MYRTFLAVALGLVACTDEPPVFQADVPVPGGAWARAFSPAFTFHVADTLHEHDVYIDLRHTGDYPYSDLYLFVHLQRPDGKQLRDTVLCPMADPTGKWFGTGTGWLFADRYKAHVLYKFRNRFPVRGEYAVRIEQAMRVDPLAGIVDVGLAVERSAPPR